MNTKYAHFQVTLPPLTDLSPDFSIQKQTHFNFGAFSLLNTHLSPGIINGSLLAKEEKMKSSSIREAAGARKL